MENTRLLVIDDDPAFQTLLDMHLTGLGIPAPVCADNGQHALALIASSERFDVIFCDVFMPEMDGIEFVRKSDYDGPMVMMSGKNETFLAGAALIGGSGGANIVETLVKPFGADEVKAALVKAGIRLDV